MKDKTAPVDVYSLVTTRIIEQLEKGKIPWKQPWTISGIPKNLITGKAYRGINTMLLTSLGYAQNHFLSYNQAKSLDATVRKGEQGHEVIFWKWIDFTDSESGEKAKLPFLRYYTVFNIEQCDGIPETLIPLPEKQNSPLRICEEILEHMPQKPEIRHKENEAYYNPCKDFVNMPKMNNFSSSEAYYGTLFHELLHSTGHVSRLNRKELMLMQPFGSDTYSIEELTAEIGSCYLRSFAGIAETTMDNSTAYIQGWLSKLKGDKRFIVYASSQAQKATDFILNVKFEERVETNSNVATIEQTKSVSEILEDDLPF